jgi:hypothetical protein
MSDVDESDFCPDPADYGSGEPDAAMEFGNTPDNIDNMVVVAVPAGPAKVVDAKSEKESERESVWNKLIDLSCRAQAPTSSFVIHAEKILGERLFFYDHAFMTESEVCEYRSSGATPYRIAHFQAREIEKLWLMHNPPEPRPPAEETTDPNDWPRDDGHDLEDFSDEDDEMLTPFDRQSVLQAIMDCDKLSDKYKAELDLKLSTLWESV